MDVDVVLLEQRGVDPQLRIDVYKRQGHMYAFSPDTLDRYYWEEVLAKKKYWFTASRTYHHPDLQPEDWLRSPFRRK